MLGKDWKLDMNGTFSWTPSINESEPMSPADQSVGKQLPIRAGVFRNGDRTSVMADMEPALQMVLLQPALYHVE